MLKPSLARYTAWLSTASGCPSCFQYIFPIASRPWRQPDIEANEKLGELPYVNARGFVDFRPSDPENPRNWSRPRCWYICGVAIFLALNGTVASGLSSGCADAVASHFGVSTVAANLTTTLFVAGYCGGPFLFAPLSEFYGRRWLVYFTFSLYLAFTILCAVAPNFASLLVGRFLSGLFVSGPLCAAPGIVADLWDPLVRDNIMVLFALAVWAGPSLGTVAAALLADAKDWRWVFYFALMLGAVTVAAMVTVPETLAASILKEKAQRHRQAYTSGRESWKTEEEASTVSLLATYKTAMVRPWALLFDSISALCAIYMGVVFLLQFMLFSVYPIIFHEKRAAGWSTTNAQLPLLGAVVGALIGAVFILFDTRRRGRVFQRRGYLVPEDHLRNAKIGGIGFPVCMFWFAWTGQYGAVHWIVPTLAGTFLSASLMLVFLAVVNYIVQSYGQYSASIIAVNTFARSAGSAAAPLFTNAMFAAMGVGGGGSLVAGVAALLSACPFVFSRYGETIRARSKYTAFGVAKPPTEEPAGEEHPTSYSNVERESSR
ncbi:hypothetical protein PWT90_01013 [Aphanocladium album]|nr:hypothetical protein PWT90_01013 [Aphanocladium album]